MALLRQQMEFSMRPSNKEFQWQDPVDDLFESFINPESFHLPRTEVQRNCSNDFINFFDAQASSSGSDTLETSPIPDVDSAHQSDANSWHSTALSFVDGDAEPTSIGRRLSIYSAPHGRAATSETDLLKLELPSTEITSAVPQSPTTPTPSCRTVKIRRLFDAPLVVRKKPRTYCSKVEKPNRRSSVSPSMMSSHYRPSSQQRSDLWNRRIQHVAAEGHLDLKLPSRHQLPTSPPPSAQLKSRGFHHGYGDDTALRSPSAYPEEIEPPISPLSTDYFHFQPPNTPVVSPIFDSHLTSPRFSFHEPQPDGLSSYPSTPLTTHPQTFLMTPPQTQPMDSTQWAPHNPSMHIASPEVSGPGKAEQWFTDMAPSDPSEVTCGAPSGLDVFGLGISGTNMSHDIQSLSRTPGAGGAMLPLTSPTPRTLGSTRQMPLFSASASSPIPPSGTSTPALYPMSPSSSMLDPGVSTQAYAQSMHPQPGSSAYRPHHQRHHTIDTTLSSIPPSVLSQPSYTPLHSGRTPSASPPAPSRSHRRAKSAHHSRRKSSGLAHGSNAGSSGARAANVGFVNFTPYDSKKILTGVAPSGSSKTKARREKEAAEKRRKLSEAAKRAVLEAGGDLGALEQEVLALNSDV